MKLRLQFNSIRLRLKRSEVERFARTGRVEEKIVLGGGPGEALHYVLEATDTVSSPQVSMDAGQLLVRVPVAAATHWVSSDEVSIEGDQAADGQTALHVLIEKDFACLDGTDEQNADTFPHPLSGTKC